jgi:prepilin-type processing-associated H-X9-DG protein
MRRWVRGGVEQVLGWAIGVLALVIAGILLYPVSSRRPRPADRACFVQLKQLAVGTIMYVDDNVDRFPLADRWMDDLSPYIKDASMYRCPLVEPKAGHGYAMNRFLAGVESKKLAKPAEMHLVYDSKGLEKNLTEYLPMMPIPGRHRGVNNVAFADGHAKAFSAKLED